MRVLLDLGKRYFPELRRWELHSEDDSGTRVLIDKQTKELVEIPKYHFAFFPAGNPTVVPYDLVAVLALPTPRVVIPKIDTLEERTSFAEKYNAILSDNIGPKFTLDGMNKEHLFLDYPLEYISMSKIFGKRETVYQEGAKGQIQLHEGDTLFAYNYPTEPKGKKNLIMGDLDYMPTSTIQKLTEVPAVDTIDLSTPAHLRDWKEIWPMTK